MTTTVTLSFRRHRHRQRGLAGLQAFPSPKSQDIGHVVEESATNGGAVGAMPKPEDVGMFQM